MAGIDQQTLWQLASMILGKRKAQPTTRERATFLRTDSDGTQWVRLPSSNDETPVNGRTLATAKAGDTVEWSIDNGRLSITGNSTSPSVGKDYVGQEVSVVTKRVDAVKADIVETNELLATKATITELEAESARIDELEADHVSVSDFQAEQASIDSLQAATADIDTIRANSAKVQNLTAAQLEADHAKVGQLDVSQIAADHATIGNLDTTYMHANMSNSDVAWIQNGTIKDGAIVSAMIHDVSANKLTAGTINGSVINVTNLNADNITAGTINGQRIGQGSLSLDKLSESVYTESEVNDIVDDLNDRIDGAIQTYTGTVVPTLNNSPASSWNTTALKDEHVGDVYYVVNSQSQQNGYCYRFTKSGSTYSWQLIKDSDVTAALSRLTTAEGKITSIESFDSTVSSFMTNTDSELTSVKSRATSLETRMTDAEGDISEKVDTSTFNTLSQTVDENSASITSMGTVISNNGLTSSTNITNTVNTVSQTATGNSSKITQLTTTLGTNADGTTKTGDIMHRTSAVEQDLSGFKTTVSQTYATNTAVDGLATRVSTAESNITQNANDIALKVSESDVTGNYVVGKINLNSTTASIAANHINLQGAVTISDLASDASTALTNAAETATSYVTELTGEDGIMVHPSDDGDTGVQITGDVDILRDGHSVINVGTQGDTSGNTNAGVTIYDGTSSQNVVATFAGDGIGLAGDAFHLTSVKTTSQSGVEHVSSDMNMDTSNGSYRAVSYLSTDVYLSDQLTDLLGQMVLGVRTGDASFSDIYAYPTISMYASANTSSLTEVADRISLVGDAQIEFYAPQYMMEGKDGNRNTWAVPSGTVVWSSGSSGWQMAANVTATLDYPISSCPSGVVLHWQAYVSGATQDYDHVYTFVPKQHVVVSSGKGVVCQLANSNFGYVGTKYVYVADGAITGNANNQSTGTANGITYANNHWVLTQVIAV